MQDGECLGEVLYLRDFSYKGRKLHRIAVASGPLCAGMV